MKNIIYRHYCVCWEHTQHPPKNILFQCPSVSLIEYSPDGKYIAITSPSSIYIYNNETSTLTSLFPAGQQQQIASATFYQSNNILIVLSVCGESFYYSIDTKEKINVKHE